MLNFSPASERNKAVILEQLTPFLKQHTDVLEIGSGSGQHALHMAPHFPHLTWTPSELSENLDALRFNLSAAVINNIAPARCLDVTHVDWDLQAVPDLVYTANTLHIMPEVAVRSFFTGVGRELSTGGRVCIYGPFRYGGAYTSASNAEFDQWLQARDPLSAIRDMDDLARWADQAGLTLEKDIQMPANNQLLIWKKV